ncbi:MAG: type III polyketide synthase [Planctomycetes bacterium]|nr:type III polyketide synthase [Planctomycetota bacterium]
MRIAAVGRALPRHRYTQDEIRGALEQMWGANPSLISRLRTLHEHVRVETRHTALPLPEYFELDTFGKANDAWIRCATELGQQALTEALAKAGLLPRDIDAMFTASVTGIASPSLEAKLMNRMDLRSDMKRIPIFGLGCVAGAAGIARAADYVRGFPDQVAVLLSVELCSLTFQREDVSIAHVISSGLFGDGAAAVVMIGEERAKQMGLRAPRVLSMRSVFYPDTEDVMGWRISERGFELVLSAQVPVMAREHLGPDVDRFLQSQGLTRSDIKSWVCHPGGPKVLQGMQDSLGLVEEDVRFSWQVLREQGNLSSTSVLMVLREVMDRARPKEGELGLIMAMGPAFCSELVLVRW